MAVDDSERDSIFWFGRTVEKVAAELRLTVEAVKTQGDRIMAGIDDLKKGQQTQLATEQEESKVLVMVKDYITKDLADKATLQKLNEEQAEVIKKQQELIDKGLTPDLSEVIAIQDEILATGKANLEAAQALLPKVEVPPVEPPVSVDPPASETISV